MYNPEEETTSLLSGLSVVVKSTIRKLPKSQPSLNECGHQDDEDGDEEEDFFLLNLRASKPLVVAIDDKIKNRRREGCITVGSILGNRVSEI